MTPDTARRVRQPDRDAPLRHIVGWGYAASVVALVLAGLTGQQIAGSAGMWGAVLGVAVPVVFLSLTVVTALLTARLTPTGLGMALVASWPLKIVALLVFLALVRDATFFSRGAFFAAFAPTVIGYLILEAWVTLRTRVPYVEIGRNSSA